MMIADGISKFRLQFSLKPGIPDLNEIRAWREIMYLMRLIGQNPNRYGGFGYGNISRRFISPEFPEDRNAFIISGSQTGHLPDLCEEHYTLVTDCRPEENYVAAEGPIRPSSESLTHAALYRTDLGICAVIHAHSPQIWQNAERLKIAITSENAEYGTPEMAAEIRRLLSDSSVKEKGIFAMGGHEDGVVSFGKSLEIAGCVLICCLADALKFT
jgi:hypothetical protein